MSYELCKRAKLGLQTFYSPISKDYFIAASEVEAMLQNAKVVKRKKGTTLWTDNFNVFSFEPDEQARLVMIEEIKREPLSHEFTTEVKKLKGFGYLYTSMVPASFVGKKIRVKIEEVE